MTLRVLLSSLAWRLSGTSRNPNERLLKFRGGIVTSGMAIYDTMQFIRPALATLCIGQAASMGSLLLAAGEKGMR